MLVDIIVVDVEVVDVEVGLVLGVGVGDVVLDDVAVGDVFDLFVKCKVTPVAIPPVTNPKTKPSTNHFFFETF